jgi:Putative GTPase activating protein for Arf
MKASGSTDGFITQFQFYTHQPNKSTQTNQTRYPVKMMDTPTATVQLDRVSKMQERLNAVIQRRGNIVCVDCGEPHPTWASLLGPASEGERHMCVLCCFQCYSHHFQLGKNVCEMKSLKKAADCKFWFVSWVYP